MSENRDNSLQEKLRELNREIEIYKQAIQDAEDALASAEKEMDETLEAEYSRENG